jgi:hypothetical protein
MITWNGYAEPEVEASTLVALAPSGTLLTYSPGGTALGLTGNSGKLGLLTNVADPIDAIMVSEIISDSNAKDQQYIYTDIDYSYWTKIGEPLNVLKCFKGLTMSGLPIVAPGTDALAGTELIVDTATSTLKVRPGGDAASPTVAVTIDKILTGATVTGKIHMQ